jgi:succinylglutamate desuccinylase
VHDVGSAGSGVASLVPGVSDDGVSDVVVAAGVHADTMAITIIAAITSDKIFFIFFYLPPFLF